MRRGSIVALILLVAVLFVGCEALMDFAGLTGDGYGTLPGPSLIWADEPYGVPLVLNWEPVEGATAYSIYRSYMGMEPVHLGYYDATSHIDGEVEMGAQYMYEIASLDANGYEGDRSDPLFVTIGGGGTEGDTTQATLPPPADIRFWDATSDSILIEWDPVTGASEYRITATLSAGGSQVSSVITPFTAVEIFGLSPNTEYYLEVAAVDSYGAEGESNILAASTRASIASPTGVVPSAEGMNSFELSWNSVTGAAWYSIQWSTDDSFRPNTYDSAVVDGASTWHEITGLQAGTTYYFRVASMIDDGGHMVAGEYSWYAATQTAADTTLPPPASVDVLDVTSGSVELSWSSVPGASGYVVYEGTSNNVSTATEHSVAGTSLLVDGLPAATLHYFWVAADDGGQVGNPSASPIEATTFSTILPPDLAGAAITSGSGSIAIDWSAVSGATGYRVSIATAELGTYQVIATPSSDYVEITESAPGAPLDPSTTYWVEVSSLDGSGVAGVPSAPRQVQTAGAADTITVSVNVVSPEDITIEFSGDQLELDKTAADTMTVTTTLSAASYTWYVDSTGSSTSSSLTVDSTSLALGTHRVTLVASQDGKLYSSDFTFDVVEN